MASHTRRRLRVMLAVSTAAIAVAATAVFTMDANAAVPSAPSGMTTIFSDDFTGAAGTGLNTANWLYDTGTSYASGAAAAGYWPAFWALGAAARPVGATNWPSIGEWDIMEDINGRSSVFSTLHCGTASGGPCNETTGLGSGEHACSGCQTGFHTYAVEYDRSVSPEQLRFYLDGSNYFTLNSSQLDATTWNNATHHGF